MYVHVGGNSTRNAAFAAEAVGHVAREPHIYVPTLQAEFVGPESNEIAGRGTLPLESMPNALPMTVDPGTCVAFDNATWHTALPHSGGDDRRSLIVAFQSAAEGGQVMRAEQLRELERQSALTPGLRELLGATELES
jgi:ectoine hydroxylase-related dioxygenase (phytanoyl-CoA dioxygenase family)